MTGRISLRSKLAAGDTILGSWLSLAHPPVAEILARSGFEFLVIDQEHAAIGAAECLHLIQIVDLCGVQPWVRVGANEARLIKRALDSGAAGVVVPSVNSAEDAEAAVVAARYPPVGRRGAGLFRAQAYGLGFPAYRALADADTVVVVQIEHVDGVAHLEDILDVPGVDAFMVGPYDLSGSVGQPGAYDHPDVREALQEVERVMKATHIPGGFHVVHSNVDELQRRLRAGYRLIAYGDDMVFLAEKVQREAELARSVVREMLGG